MTIEDILKGVCDHLGYELYKDYSGRGMYGKKCIGIVGQFNIFQICSYISDNVYHPEDVLLMFEEHSIDSMGLDRILYWEHLDGSEVIDE